MGYFYRRKLRQLQEERDSERREKQFKENLEKLKSLAGGMAKQSDKLTHVADRFEGALREQRAARG